MISRMKKTRLALLAMLCSATFGSGACLPENFVANLFQSISTNGVNLVLQSVIATGLDAVGLFNPLEPNVVIVEGGTDVVGGP